MADEVRADAGVAVDMFRQDLGIDDISMITGDSKSVAFKVGGYELGTIPNLVLILFFYAL